MNNFHKSEIGDLIVYNLKNKRVDKARPPNFHSTSWLQEWVHARCKNTNIYEAMKENDIKIKVIAKFQTSAMRGITIYNQGVFEKHCCLKSRYFN